MVAGSDLSRRSALLLSAYRYRRAMLVRARDHEHIVALKPMIPGEDVRRQIGTSDMTQMKRAIGIGPGNRN